MDILLIDPPYIGLKGMPTDRGYNMGPTSLAAYLCAAGLETAVLTGDLFAERRPRMLRAVMPDVFQNMNRYASGQREYARTINTRAHPVWRKMADVVRETKPLAAGISYLTPVKSAVAKVAAIIKATDPGIKIIVGSFHPTFCPDEVIENPDIDFVIRGEGEKPLAQLVQALKKGGTGLETVPGLSYRDGDGRVKHNRSGELINNLDELPFPARDLVINCDYTAYRLHSIATTRGCPYSCSFCGERDLWGGKVRRRAVASVTEELRSLKEDYRPSYVDIVDGTFTYDRKYLSDFCQALLDQELEIKWRCTARYDNLDEDLLKLMKRSGCAGLYFGLESGSDRVLRSIDKKITVADITRVSRIVYELGILSETSVLLGLPDENQEDIEATLGLMRTVKTDKFDVNSFIPLPGTTFWEAMSEEEKRQIDWLIIGYKSYDNYFSKGITREEFSQLRDEAYRIADSVLRRTILRLGARKVFQVAAGLFRG
ncbi:MAG: hypothetical protein A2Z29_05010 [Chloroflexi bacterium RBG_16_56_11]|nr:MAG: hypothetical protein A2Z29_05010 [Chloroflexi bacterium RBG_16_56_11]